MFIAPPPKKFYQIIISLGLNSFLDFLSYLFSNFFIHINVILWCDFKCCKKCIWNLL